jgi:H+-transporting ATPase
VTQTAFTTKKKYGMEEREAQWATTQRSLHGLPAPEPSEQGRYYAAELSEMAAEARRRADVAKFRERFTFRGHLESSAKLRGVDLSGVKSPYYTM